MDSKKKLKIKYVKLTEITPYERNPRVISEEAVTKVQESIESFGFKQPIIVDNNMVIIAGHTRYKAATNLELEEVPIIVVEDLTEEQVQALRIADNKTGEYSEWDNDLLKEIFEELEQNGLDLYTTGFSANEIEDILKDAEDELGSLDLIRDESDVSDATVKKLVFGKYKCVLTDEEFEKLEKIYLDYVEMNTTSFGFISYLLEDNKE